MVHGHLLGARRAWKALLESRAFFKGFSYVPGPFARALDRILAWRNLRGLDADEERHLRVYRDYAAQHQGSADLVIFGHVHRPVDLAQEASTDRPGRLATRRSSFLKIDASGASFHVEHECDQQHPSHAAPAVTDPSCQGGLDEV